MDANRTTRISNHSDEITKLEKRINCNFKKCTYIGDIPINDEEYVLFPEQYGVDDDSFEEEETEQA